jgi:hypothetical protein
MVRAPNLTVAVQFGHAAQLATMIMDLFPWVIGDHCLGVDTSPDLFAFRM